MDVARPAALLPNPNFRQEDLARPPTVSKIDVGGHSPPTHLIQNLGRWAWPTFSKIRLADMARLPTLSKF